MEPNEKQITKALKAIGADTKSEMDAMAKDSLEEVIVQAEKAMSQAERERNSNPHFLAAKENLKALGEGLREVKKRQNAKIVYALHRLEEIGE